MEEGSERNQRCFGKAVSDTVQVFVENRRHILHTAYVCSTFSRSHGGDIAKGLKRRAGYATPFTFIKRLGRYRYDKGQAMW
jgi:hypothetical protein